MAGSRQSIAVVKEKGKKHLTKDEIARREQEEIRLNIPENVIAPKYLIKGLHARFYYFADLLLKAKILTELDVDCLARFLMTEKKYIAIDKKANAALAKDEIENMQIYFNLRDKLAKQCRAEASDLGLSISSRCKLIVPKIQEDENDDKDNMYG